MGRGGREVLKGPEEDARSSRVLMRHLLCWLRSRGDFGVLGFYEGEPVASTPIASPIPQPAIAAPTGVRPSSRSVPPFGPGGDRWTVDRPPGPGGYMGDRQATHGSSCLLRDTRNLL